MGIYRWFKELFNRCLTCGSPVKGARRMTCSPKCEDMQAELAQW